MSVTVVDLLQEHPPEAFYGRFTSGPSLSRKPWTDAYHPISDPTVHVPTLDGVNQFLASEQYIVNSNSFYTADPSDHDRLDKRAYPLNYLDCVHIQSEADVTRDFHQNLSLPVSLAWQKRGDFLERSLSGPPGPSSTDKTVDHFYSWQVEGVAADERCQVIGEMKQHGVIDINQWEGREAKSSMTKKLGRELRAYAYLYKCPQVFVYDGQHLLIVQFKANDVNDIRSTNCPIDCCVLARSPEIAQCGARYALYRLIWRGWIRLTAQFSSHIPVSLGGWQREFRFWSGRPRWVNLITHAKELDHPLDCMRSFDGRSWYWQDINGNELLNGDGNILWDSLVSW